MRNISYLFLIKFFLNENCEFQQDSGFSWGNVLSMVMQLLFNPAGQAGPSKSDAIDTDQVHLRISYMYSYFN